MYVQIENMQEATIALIRCLNKKKFKTQEIFYIILRETSGMVSHSPNVSIAMFANL